MMLANERKAVVVLLTTAFLFGTGLLFNVQRKSQNGLPLLFFIDDFNPDMTEPPMCWFSEQQIDALTEFGKACFFEGYLDTDNRSIAEVELSAEYLSHVPPMPEYYRVTRKVSRCQIRPKDGRRYTIWNDSELSRRGVKLAAKRSMVGSF